MARCHRDKLAEPPQGIGVTDPILMQIQARLDAIDERLMAHRTEMHREWSQARDQRDALGRELDAFNVEMLLVQADIQQLRTYMTDAPHTTDEITIAVDEFVVSTRALISDDRHVAIEPFARALGTLIAVIIGRATVQAASAVVGSHRTLEDRIDAHEVAIAELKHRAVGGGTDGT